MRLNVHKKYSIVLIAALFGLQFVLLWKQHTEIRQLTQSLHSVQSQIAVTSPVSQIRRVTIMPSENAVLLPDLGIKLPLNSITSQFVYSVRSADEADISTAVLNAYPLPPQPIGCSTSVRIKLEDKPNPYNPHETVRASVKLANGKTLQAYSYQHDTCDTAFKASGIDSVAQATAFKEAKSY